MRCRVNGIHLGVDDAGHGAPLLFVHGFPHDRTLWAPQLSGLCTRCRCVAPDLRGFGESDVAEPFGMDQYADDLAGLLDARRIDRAVVIGISMGGYVSFALWRRHADRVRALVLVDTRAAADDNAARARRSDLIALAESRGAGAVADAMMTGMVGRTTRERNPDLVLALRDRFAGTPVAGLVGALRAMRDRPDSTPTLRTITVPTLVIAGEEDAIVPRREQERVSAGIPDARFAVIPGAGHVCNVERPAAFNAIVSQFLSDEGSIP